MDHTCLVSLGKIILHTYCTDQLLQLSNGAVERKRDHYTIFRNNPAVIEDLSRKAAAKVKDVAVQMMQLQDTGTGTA